MSTPEKKQSALKTCLEESDNPRMQNYVKILDTPNITAMEWIHRTQEELMDGIVYLEKLKNVFTINMMELDAAARIVAERRAAQEQEANVAASTEEGEGEEVEEININITVPVPDEKAPEPAPKKRATKTKAKAKAPVENPTDEANVEKEKKTVKKRKSKATTEEA